MLRLPVLITLALLAQIGIAAAQNVATNPGFETGNTSGWFPFGSPTLSATTAQAHSGTYSALVTNRTASYMGIAQSFQGVLTSGQTYNVSAWVRLVSGANQTVNLTMQKVDGAGTSYTFINSSLLSPNNWTQLSGQYTPNISGSLTSLVFYVEVASSSNASYYLDDVNVSAVVAPPTTNGQCTIDWTNTFQHIDGFGASSAWRSTWNSAQADLFFSTNTGAGLSLLRTRIAPGATTVEGNIMQFAQARGARVWSAPWSPQTSYKSNNANGVISINGGPFVGNPANYQAYANQLAGYVVNMQTTYGVSLYALSVQNEPDTDTTNYESCVWTGQQFHDFIPYLSASLAASNVGGTKIMMPESIHWANTSLHTTTMNDGAVAPLVSIIANHNYDGPNFQTPPTSAPVALNNYGKALWETEVSSGDNFDGSITNAVYWAGRVHQYMTVAQANAWHFWWLVGNADNQGLTDQFVNPAKRLYALGNFARFVRPNFFRIGVTNTGPLQVSAYKDPTNSAVAIVVINPTTNAVAQTFMFSGFNMTNLTPWLTSASASLASQAPVAVYDPIITNTIPALSIVTFVGRVVLPNSAPTNIILSNAALGENQPPATPVGNFTTADADLGNTFTYTLVGGTGSTDNGSFSISGTSLLSATTFNYEAQNTFSIRVRSTDQGALFTEKVFTINVTNINEPPSDITLANASIAENQPAGANVGGLSTTDPDVGNTFTYTLVSGAGSTGNASFSISGSNLLTAASFNYETQNSFSIRVRSTDQGGASIEKEFTITITNVNEPPALATVPDVTVGAGVTVILTNSATDPELPAQTLTFNLLSGPLTSSLNASNGIFTWRPLVTQANTTNLITVQVSDNGLPALSATNSSQIIVSPLAAPVITSITATNGIVNLVATGALGPDYTLLSSDNLVNWQSLLTTNVTSMPATFTITNQIDAANFYRLQLGP